MTDSNEPKRLPRKILGMNSRHPPISQSNMHSSDSMEHCFAQESTLTTSMDHMRFANMNQEMHSIWPYGTYLSPVLPAPTLGLPYTLTPNVPYTAVPIYQTVANGATVSGGSSNQQNSNNREPSNMLIQIGLQCVNQNNPVNINSMNDMGTTIGTLNIHYDQTEGEKKDDSSSMRSSPMCSDSRDNNNKSVLRAADPSYIIASQAKLEDLKALVLTTSEIAEKLAYIHRNRPCFKKIDSLCARMKQDLIRPDGVVPNINSQGTAWAVKDFIFAFTRVISGWIIMKGYVYNTPEGLNKVRSALSPNFERSFSKWQDSTLDLVENIKQSLEGLENLVQSQKNVYQKVVSTTPMKCGSDESIDFLNSSMDSGVSKDDRNYMYTVVEDSDATQGQNTSNGTYFKTGTYNIIKREPSDDGPTSLEQFFDETFAKVMPNTSICYDLAPSHARFGESRHNCEISVLEDKLFKFSAAYDPQLPKPLGKDLVDKLNLFISRLMEVKSADLFFKIQFCRNYFPDFISKTPDFVDLCSIILKCEAAGYEHIFEVVHDIKRIIYQTRVYLKNHPDQKLEQAIMSFQVDVEKMLAEEPFANYQFEHIKGKPNEMLYNSVRKILGMSSQFSPNSQSNLHSSDSLENCFPRESTLTTSMDRMRIANIMNQEMHSIWPYGTFLSPVLPASNLGLPYALAPNMPCTAVPLYQTVANGATVSGGNSNQQQTQPNSNNREPSKMLIQIGLQCVNQNNPVNINSMNDTATSVGKLNLHFDQAEAGKKDDSSSLRSSPVSSGSKDKDICDFNNSCSTLGAGDPSHIILSQAKFEELKTLALTTSEIAEKLAYTHRNRPCFKKIDSLCARMKQDLIRPDGVLPNINSQGIAWAVKDFIFVFTRVINAWIIIKGYVYNTPEGLNKVRSALSPDFVRSFAEWQDSTMDFVENLKQSFVNLNNLVQSQNNVYQRVVSTAPMKCGSDDSIDFLNSSMESGVSKENRNYMYTMVEDSDATQRQNTLNGTYFKTGTYNFIKRESSDDGSTGLERFFDETFAKSIPDIGSTYDPSPSHMSLGESKLNCDIRVLENKLSKFSSAYDPNFPKPLGKDLVDKLNVFMNRLMEVKSADLFFKIQFCRNYFPDFILNTPDFVDLRSIILKCQAGGYGHIFEVVHDIKRIIYQAKTYLKKHPNPELEKAIICFDVGFEKMLTKEPFENYELKHIKGKPNEILYNSGKYVECFQL